MTPALRTALNEAGVLSYRPLLFEDAAAEFRPPAAYPREALTCLSTHDLPTWRGFWEGHDLALREKFGLTIDPEKERSLRGEDKERLKRALERDGFDTTAAGARVSRANAVEAGDGAARGRVRARRAGEPSRHGGRASQLAAQAPGKPGALEGRCPRAAPCREHGGRSFFKDSLSFVPKRVATYRLQLHGQFRFADATALVPYLAELGVSHVYASPFLHRQHARLRCGRPRRHQSRDRHRGRPAPAARHAAPPRDGPRDRRGAQPHGRPARRQPVVAGRAREGQGLTLRQVLRHRLAARPRPPPASRPGQASGRSPDDGEIRLAREGKSWAVAGDVLRPEFP